MNWKDNLEESKKLFTQAKAILENKDSTPEDRAKVAPMLIDAKKFQADAAQLKEIEEAAALLADNENKGAQNKPQGSEGFVSWGDFLQATWMASHPNIRKVDPRLRSFKDNNEEAFENKAVKGRKDMAEAVGSTGGFLVPVEQQTNLLSIMAETSHIRPKATIIPMRRRQVNIPVLDQTGTTSGIPHWFGGLRFYWAEEAEQKTESDAAFRQISLVAHKLIGYTRASDELVDDSAISLDAFLSGPLGFAGGVSWMEDYSFFQGTGAGQPLGVINAGATISVARQAGGPLVAIGYTDLVNMFESFLPSTKGEWCFTQSAISNLMLMQDPSGQYLWPTLFQGGASTGRPPSLLGMPWHITEKLPRVGTAGDIVLADWTYYLIGDRQATTVESTKFGSRWEYDQTQWRVVHRVDGQPWLSAPLTYQDAVTTVSPFVILGAKTT